MGVDFRAVVAVGFELSYEDYAAEISWRISHEPDEGRKWAKEIQDYLIILDCYTEESNYIFSDNYVITDQSYGQSILSLFKGAINYERNKEMIAAFNRLFPRVDKESHQLDILYALKVD